MAEGTTHTSSGATLTKITPAEIQKPLHDWVNGQGLRHEGKGFVMDWENLDRMAEFVGNTLFERYDEQCRTLHGSGTTTGATSGGRRVSEPVEQRDTSGVHGGGGGSPGHAA